MTFEQIHQYFFRELRLFLELWKKTENKDPEDIKRFMEDLKRRINRNPFITIADVGDREALITISRQIKNDFSQLGEKYGEKVYEILAEGMKKNEPRKALYDRAMREVRKGKQYAYTWINTSENAVNQAKKIRDNIEAGVKYFKYAGPPADREFCQHLLGKVYTIEEIEQMDNGQGLPVLYYKGGYNCRHRWAPVNNLAGEQRGDVIPIAHKNKIVELKPVNITEKVKKDIESDLQNLNKITNKKDLITWCKDNVANNVTEGFAELDIEDIRQIAMTLYKLNYKFGLPPVSMLGKERGINASYSAKTDTIKFHPEIANYINDPDTVSWQRAHYDKKGLYKDTDIHSFYLSKNTEDVTVHEYGHRFHLKFNLKKLNVMYNEYINTKEWQKYKIGRANDNPKEYFAEMFSRYYHGADIPKELKLYFDNSIIKEV
ncbi:MAG: hypothetical protein QXF70_03445 [Candidatus Bilamarchaeaceae archaeon]